MGRLLAKKQPAAAAPSGEDFAVDVVPLTEEQKGFPPPAGVVVLVLPAMDGRCAQCAQLPEACSGRHALVELVRDVALNGVQYRVGTRVLPEDAFHVWKFAIKE